LHLANDDPSVIGKIARSAAGLKGTAAVLVMLPGRASTIDHRPRHVARRPAALLARGSREEQIIDTDVAKIHTMKSTAGEHFNLESVSRGTAFGLLRARTRHALRPRRHGARQGVICRELIDANSDWQHDTMQTVRSSAQLWLPDLAKLGWTMPETINGAYKCSTRGPP
jgi:hypothetical protein